MGARGLRNNNPLNIRLSATRWKGEVRPSQDKAFCQFETMAYGYRAGLKLLRNYAERYGCRTVRTMISRWAPPSENDTRSYISTVCHLARLDADRRLNTDDRRTMCRMAAAMSQVENGVPAVMADVEAGWELL